MQLPYIRVLGLTEINEGARGNAKFTEDEHQEFKAFSQRPFKEVILDIRSKVAPAIFGSDDVKMAVACLMFSGSRKYLQDGARLRGDVNVLLLGDPSTAKSQFLKFVERTPGARSLWQRLLRCRFNRPVIKTRTVNFT